MYFGERLRSGTGRDERGRERERESSITSRFLVQANGWMGVPFTKMRKTRKEVKSQVRFGSKKSRMLVRHPNGDGK